MYSGHLPNNNRRQPSQDEETVAEEEDALVLRMEAMMAEADQEEMEHLSFADSERFDEDDEEQFSAQASESSSFSHNWRGWAGKYQSDPTLDSSTAEFLHKLPLFHEQTASTTCEENSNQKIFHSISTLRELAARTVASALSFEMIEYTYASLPRAQKRLRPAEDLEDNISSTSSAFGTICGLQDYLPEQLMLLILRHCFPVSVENIRLYSCLTNCGDRLFALGEQLFQNNTVSELYQIGYHLSAVVRERYSTQNIVNVNQVTQIDAHGTNERCFNVCIRVDRCRIVSCSCSCSNSSFWCQHAVATCLQRIQNPDSVNYRPAIWDSITSLRDKELKKLAQYLINELPKEYLPVAQKLIDALKNPSSEINQTQGAPDPTAGLTDDMPAVWCMDERALHEEVRKTLIKFMRPSAMVCEVQSLLTSPPALAHEWSTLHRTLYTKQPESMWNLLGMVRLMLSRGDANAPSLLHVFTEQCLALDSVLLRWYQISLVASGHWHPIGPNGGAANGGMGVGGSQPRGNAQQTQSRQLHVFLLCEELVVLWRLVAVNPRLNLTEKERLWSLLQLYQRTAVARIWSILGKTVVAQDNNIRTGQHMSGTIIDRNGHRLSQSNAVFTRHHFAGFFPAMQACRQFDWNTPEIQRLLQTMEMGNRVDIDIKMAQKQPARFPNIPLLRDSPNGLFLLDLVEMEHQLSSTGTYNPDAVVLPSKTSRRRRRKKREKRRRGGGFEKETRERSKRTNKNEVEAESEHNQKPNGNWEDNMNANKTINNENEPSVEQLSEVSTDEDTIGGIDSQQHEPHYQQFGQQRREPYQDELDALFAEAHAEPDDPFMVRYTCCEALFAHGYFREALQLADQLAVELLEHQPNLLPSPGMTADQPMEQHHRTMIRMNSVECADELAENSSGSSIENNNALTASSSSQKMAVIKGRSSAINSYRHHHVQFCRRSSGDSFRGNFSTASSPKLLFFRSHPRLMDASQRTQMAFSQTLFLAKLLLTGEQFIERKRNQQQQFGCAKANKNAESSAGKSIFMGESSMWLEPGHYRVRAFKLCLATMRSSRGPAATKLLEMQINHLEGELFTLLHRIEICPVGLRIMRSLVEQYLNNQSSSTGQWCPNSVTLPPTRWAHYMLNSLSYTHHMIRNTQLGGGGNSRTSNYQNTPTTPEILPPCQPEVFAHRLPSDDELALELALDVLSKDVHISEKDHPLLCECIRRHRRDLQMTLLTRNRDATEKLAKILGTVLDSKVHRMYEEHCHSNVEFFLPSTTTITTSTKPLRSGCNANTCRPPPTNSAESYSSSSSVSISPFQMLTCNEIGRSRNNSIVNSNSPALGQCGTTETNQITHLDRFPSLSSHHYLVVLANQASEAQAHHMFEFAKSLLQEAGGNQGSAMLFNPQLVNERMAGGIAAAFPGGAGGAAGPHRNLHICSLLIALYGLGLNNECSPSWNTRTYSTHVSWIQAQALDIGRQALEIIRCTWRKHLTPTEVASLADKASQSADNSVVGEASRLALSVLSEANSLLPAESQKAMNQCKEQSAKMLEEACLAVEKAAERGGVYPEVLFRVARHWHELYLSNLEKLYSKWMQQQHQQQQQNLNISLQPFQQQQQVPFYEVVPTSNSFIGAHHHPPPPLRLLPSMPPHSQIPLLHALPTPATALSTSPIFSPSIPPPCIRYVNNPSVPVNNSYRLHTSFSAPTMNPTQFPASMAAPSVLLPSALPYDRMPPPPPNTSMVGTIQQSQPRQHDCFTTAIPPPPLNYHQQQHLVYQQQPITFNLNSNQQHRMHLSQSQPQQQLQFQYARCDSNKSGVGASRFVTTDERLLQLLRNAHRVGIAAMNNLRSLDSVSAKFARHPPSGDDICWLLDVTAQIGDPEYVRLFCEKAIACVGSPFVLFKLFFGVYKFFEHFPNAHRVPGSGHLDSILDQTLTNVASDLAKESLRQAKTIMIHHQWAGPVIEVALNAIGAAFNATYHKLNFNNFSEPDKEYVCALAVNTWDLFARIQSTTQHEQQQLNNKRKYKTLWDLFMEHMKNQKNFKKSNLHAEISLILSSTMSGRHTTKPDGNMT